MAGWSWTWHRRAGTGCPMAARRRELCRDRPRREKAAPQARTWAGGGEEGARCRAGLGADRRLKSVADALVVPGPVDIRRTGFFPAVTDRPSHEAVYDAETAQHVRGQRRPGAPC